MLVLWHQHQRRFHNFGAARAEARSLSSEMKKKHWGRQKVNRSESIWGQHLPFSSLCSFLPWIFLPFHSRSCFKLLHNTTEFNQQLEMTAGADGRARSIVLACEEGAPGGNETQKERWGGRVIVIGKEGGESGQRRGKEGDCSCPMRVGVKKSEASRASKVDDWGRLFWLLFRQQSYSLKLNNESFLHADAVFLRCSERWVAGWNIFNTSEGQQNLRNPFNIHTCNYGFSSGSLLPERLQRCENNHCNKTTRCMHVWVTGTALTTLGLIVKWTCQSKIQTVACCLAITTCFHWKKGFLLGRITVIQESHFNLK